MTEYILMTGAAYSKDSAEMSIDTELPIDFSLPDGRSSTS